MYSEKNGHRKKLDFFHVFICRFYRCFGGGGLVAKLCPTLATPWTGACQAPLSVGILQATHSSVLAWRVPWTEEPCGLQSTGSQGVGQD